MNNQAFAYIIAALLVLAAAATLFGLPEKIHEEVEELQTSPQETPEVALEENQPDPSEVEEPLEIEKVQEPAYEIEEIVVEPVVEEKEEALPPEIGEFSLEEITSLVSTHDRARSEVGVTPLLWSEEVAQSAQEWADTLAARGCQMQHSDSPYGENLYYSWSTDISARRGASEPVDSWVSEKEFYSYSDNSCAPGEVCGHYTQVVWADTKEVGCGRSFCETSGAIEEIWVCQYNPPGNWVGEKPY